MSVTITMTFATAAEAAAYLANQTLPTAAQPAPAAKPAKAEAPAPAAKPAKAEAPAPTPAAEPQVSYPVLQKAVFELAAKDKAKVMALIAEQGGRSFKELAPEEWADALKRVQAATAELNSAEVA